MRDIDHRIIPTPQTDVCQGRVVYDPIKSIWWTAMTLIWAVGGTIWFSWDAVAACLITCIVTLCGGHSLGMHRRFIHESFQCPHWLTVLGVWLGTLVGLGGPKTMMHTHDLRDWAQRQSECHPYLCHDERPLKDFLWQVHGRLILDHPPKFEPSALYCNSPTLIWMQRTAFLQQAPLALILFLLGGPGWVAWAICGRVSLSIFGHWAVGYAAHNYGHDGRLRGHFLKDGAAVQGHNVRGWGLLTFGEAYHNNHHAFPESARLGLFKGQPDPGWWVLVALRHMGLVWDVVEAEPPVKEDQILRLSRSR